MPSFSDSKRPPVPSFSLTADSDDDEDDNSSGGGGSGSGEYFHSRNVDGVPSNSHSAWGSDRSNTTKATSEQENADIRRAIAASLGQPYRREEGSLTSTPSMDTSSSLSSLPSSSASSSVSSSNLKQPLYVPVSSNKVSTQWVLELRRLGSVTRTASSTMTTRTDSADLPRLELNFVGLECNLDIILSQCVGAIVRDLSKLLQSKRSFEDELGADIEELRGEYSYQTVYVIVIVGMDLFDNMSINTRKWNEIHQRLRELRGVHPLVCMDAADCAVHLLQLLKAERAANRTLRPCLSGSEEAVGFLRHAPGVSYSTAVSLVAHFRGRKMAELIQCTSTDLDVATPWLTDQQRRNLLHYFSRKYGAPMTV